MRTIWGEVFLQKRKLVAVANNKNLRTLRDDERVWTWTVLPNDTSHFLEKNNDWSAL